MNSNMINQFCSYMESFHKNEFHTYTKNLLTADSLYHRPKISFWRHSLFSLSIFFFSLPLFLSSFFLLSIVDVIVGGFLYHLHACFKHANYTEHSLSFFLSFGKEYSFGKTGHRIIKTVFLFEIHDCCCWLSTLSFRTILSSVVVISFSLFLSFTHFPF